MKRIIIVFFVILAVKGVSPIRVYGEIPDQEYMALQALYNTTGSSHWSKSDNWFAGAAPVNTWYGITCDPGKTAVIGIKLPHNKLKGELPSMLGQLSNLESLVLNHNELTAVHKNLGKLSKLKTLDLSNNKLEGPIPSWIGDIENLTELNLSNNKLTGSIPSWIRKIKNLTILNLGNNRLSGSIPPWFGEMANLEELLLDANMLEGAIPAELGKLTKLEKFRIGHNRLEGKIPSSLGKLTNLEDDRSNFKWNALYIKNQDSLKAFLNKKQISGDWESTQTIHPEGLSAGDSTFTSITVKWESIAYKGDNGWYEVFYSENREGPYKSAGVTVDKTISEMEVNHLKQSTTYYFAVRTWTDPHGSNQNEVESIRSGEIAAATRGTTICGSIGADGVNGVEGVEITATGMAGYTFTDAGGNYSLGVKPGWSGIVTPRKDGYIFSPPDKKYKNINEDHSNQDYTAEPNTKIAGRIKTPKGHAVPGVELNFTDIKETAVSDDKGIYSFIVPYEWRGTVTPSKPGYKFAPRDKEYYKAVTSRLENQDYEAVLPEISGRVKNGKGQGVNNVALAFSNGGGSAVTDSKGYYSQEVLYEWPGTVTPSKRGYFFCPSARSYDSAAKDHKNQDFRAEQDLKFFISVIGSYMIPAGSNFSDTYGSGLFYPEFAAGYTLNKNIYLWTGFGWVSKKGASPVLNESAGWAQNFLSLGIGYYGRFSYRLGFKAELGISRFHYSEEAMDVNVSGEAIGVRAGGIGIFKISDRFFAEVSVGYLIAGDTVDTEEYEMKLKLGGVRAGLGLGMRF